MIEITITVRSDYHPGEHSFTQTKKIIGDDPTYYASACRTVGTALVEYVADSLDRLTPPQD